MVGLMFQWRDDLMASCFHMHSGQKVDKWQAAN